MRRIFTAPAIALALSASIAPLDSAARADHIFVVKESFGRIELEKLEIPEEGELVIEGDDVVTVVLPLGVGQSGDLVKRGMRGGTFTVRRSAGELRVTAEQRGGKRIAFPPVRIEDLPLYDIRVSVAGAGGAGEAFMIRRYEEALEDDGPVIDMFGGAVPLEDGDYSITLDIRRAAGERGFSGEVELSYEEGFLIAEGSIRRGGSGNFIVDLGAGGTVVAREFLPPYAEIEEVSGVEYSGDGRREVRSGMTGAGGMVRGFLGSSSPGDMIFGEAVFPDVTVRVVDSMPEFGKVRAAGIMGIDLLGTADRVTIEFSGGESARMILSSGPSRRRGGEPDAEIPFTMASNHIFIDGKVGSIPVSFILDTGARRSIIISSVAEEASLRDAGTGPGKVSGLDGRIMEAKAVVAGSLGLGGWTTSDVPFLCADLSVFEAMGVSGSAGLIGNDFLDDFSRVEIDFTGGVLRLWR
jgi:predicted aspartyl protease